MTEPAKPTSHETPKNGGMPIPPLNNLRDKVQITGDGTTDPEAIARAEQALKLLSVEFDIWIAEEVDVLKSAFEEVLSHGLNGVHGDTLFRAAHDIRGQAETLGYPLIGHYCASLCKLFDAVNDYSLIPMHAIQSHIEAIHVALRDSIKDDENQVAMDVMKRLREMTGEFYDFHNAAADNTTE